MSDPSSNKRPPDDSSVGSASKKPNIDDLKGSMRKNKTNRVEADVKIEEDTIVLEREAKRKSSDQTIDSTIVDLKNGRRRKIQQIPK